MEAHHTGIQWTYLKVKVTRPINAHTVNVEYLPNGKAYERQIWYTDAARRPASALSVVTFKVSGQGRKVTWCVWHLLADKGRFPLPELTGVKKFTRVLGPSTRAVNSGSGNRPLVENETS